MIEELGMLKTRGLSHEHIFRYSFMKESILYVNLLNRPTSINGKGKNNTYRCRLYDKAVGFTIVDP